MILIKNVNLVDTINLKTQKTDILISDGIIKRISDKINNKKAKLIKGEGLFAIPSLIDLHVHSRVPGKEEAEDYISLTKACLSGGVGSVVLMPNTNPPTDNINILKKLIKKAKKESVINILFSSAATVSREGKKVVRIGENARFAVCFSDDGSWISNFKIAKEVMIKSFQYGKKLFSHPEISHKSGVINEGLVSKRLNIPAIPRETEYLAVLRDSILSIIAQTPVHFQHISAKESVEIIRIAKKLNPYITAETAPHYFCFSEKNLEKLDSNFKMNPPLRTEEDRKAIIEGLRDNTIDVIATDHAPHTDREKKQEITKSPFGVIGLETLLSASLTELWQKNKIPFEYVISLMTKKPADIINLKNRGVIKEGFVADISIIEPLKKWKVESFYSKSSNSPFKGKTLSGKNIITILNGIIRYENDRFFI